MAFLLRFKGPLLRGLLYVSERRQVMMVDAGEFISHLRNMLALRLEVGDEGVLAAFDRACVQVLVDEHNEKKELTSGQKAARTRARNRQARAAVSGNSAQHANSVDREASDDKSAA